jgi:hypothetical protein
MTTTTSLNNFNQMVNKTKCGWLHMTAVLRSGCDHARLLAVQGSFTAAVVLPISEFVNAIYFTRNLTSLDNNCIIYFSSDLFTTAVLKKSFYGPDTDRGPLIGDPCRYQWLSPFCDWRKQH